MVLRSHIKKTAGFAGPCGKKVYEYPIHLHLHSTYSDGSLPIEDIAGLAEKVGLRAIFITDHGTLAGLHRRQEGYYGKVLVLIGMEINRESNHYLALGIRDEVADNEADPQKVIDAVNEQRGFGIIAHPFDKGCPYRPFNRSYPWTDWAVHDFQAIEVWNQLSQWASALRGPLRALALLLNPLRAVRHPQPDAVKVWDEFLAKGQQVFASAGSDAHGVTIRLGPLSLKVSSYEKGLETLNTHILGAVPLSGRVLADKDNILQALRQGRYWLANDQLADSRGFCFYVRNGHQSWVMGEKAPFSAQLRAYVITPNKAWVKILKNGRLWAQGEGGRHVFTGLMPAVYRAEVLLKRGWQWYTWIISNPIWVDEPAL